jgi:hypothetical protein
MEKPSVGRSVHYVAYGTPGGEFPAGVCRAAVITEIETGVVRSVKEGNYKPGESVPLGDPTIIPTGVVGLCVLNPTGIFFNRGIPYDEDKAPGSWHWPERT